MTTCTTFLGLGAMGSALAAATLDAGRPTVVWNHTPGRARALGDRGATVAETVEEAIIGGGVVVACLLDHRSVHSVVEFTEAALESLVTASLDQGVNVEVLRPVHDIVRRQITAGYGQQGTARIFEELRSSR
ncbi:hypothetical protein ThrDRAFT_02842 [Frankia casuarinae]|jgi:pyrroline-5-carboxylate reductase|uniref:6-phosphogluconate dehydrogenase, NAD-binding n=1 Tax=Frankia casuarinae (strain DSM 45818 / CECT 9043 / HFP020203 / CcI3) TaxID=106370 RepID=Q2J7U1_FRACC|nr:MULTISPECIES: NAD(P)-binding domain-containing protein [Frankia]ABD12651.1 6-phosphogluconate dehydrogenase, NAD-binding [Frankia casuarinae]EYT91507.1 hypothetical protein ThrDRAFT_02842 [Frankia casuarinae]OFB41153.1 6-phosphogluconate dehydrogenase [Frankia sp. CgIM4]ORT96033.1 6-phosphogluconate dehydrogenase [Frankia casuarinae]